MLASRQVLGNVARSRAFAGAASGIRRMASISDSPLDRKVSLIIDLHIIRCSWFVHVCWRMWDVGGSLCLLYALSRSHAADVTAHCNSASGSLGNTGNRHNRRNAKLQ